MSRTLAESVEERVQTAWRRREALSAAGCATYTLGLAIPGPGAIVCLCCGMTSHNPHDVANRYCGFCHAFHTEERPR